MRALRRFTVRAALPEPLAPLAELVTNLRWSWHPESLDLFAAVDPQRWEAVGGDPVRLLGAVSAERLDELAGDQEFLDRLAAAKDDLDAYLSRPGWYDSWPDAPASIAYFSPEYGIAEVLPQYSGGLGILAGDHLKAASDLGVPIIGVGLLYRAGYFRQSLSPDGWQLERYPAIDPYGLPLTLLREADGTPLTVNVELPEGRHLVAQLWQVHVGRVPLLLLDSDVEDNAPAERDVTDRLYGGGSDHRLRQEMLLGIGGVRAVRAFCRRTGTPEPEVFHTNEGHAGFLGLERIREYAEQGLSFDAALQTVRAGTVFTTHTPVPAGIDRFPRDLIERHFGGDAGCPGVPLERILELGAEPDGDVDVFNMAVMGLRLAQRANGVSRLHGRVSRAMFSELWPGFDPAEVPIGSITNGVHAHTWVAREVIDLARRDVGPRLVEQGQGWEGLEQLSLDALWDVRRQLRTRLVTEVRRRVRRSWLRRGASEAELGWTDEIFDPDVLTIGFARRVPSYKRLTLMLRDADRLRALLRDDERPIQLVIAGKSHPADEDGKALIQQLVRFADDREIRHRIVFLPDYDIGMAHYLYWGCDVWLNNPLRPLEACGTSGMKSALNGGLNLSIRDGWWDESYDGENGWAIPTADGVTDPDRRDELEAAALYDLLERQVAPRFYDRNDDGVPRDWVEMVRHTLRSLGPKVLATRMVHDYVTDLYIPAVVSSRRLTADNCAPAHGLAEWREHVEKAWPGVRVEHIESAGVDAPALGTQMTVRAVVDLGELSTDDVVVQAVHGPVDDDDELHEASVVQLAPDGAREGARVFAGTLALDRPGAFGYTIRVLPHHDLLATDADLGLITTPAAEDTNG